MYMYVYIIVVRKFQDAFYFWYPVLIVDDKVFKLN